MGKVLPNSIVMYMYYVSKVPLCYPNDTLIVENSIRLYRKLGL